jgi:hypothetical protein
MISFFLFKKNEDWMKTIYRDFGDIVDIVFDIYQIMSGKKTYIILGLKCLESFYDLHV